jgi:YjbE family integral membrane protein
VVLITFAMTVLQMPYIKLAGGLLLLWIGVKLFAEEDGNHEIPASDRLLAAIRTIVVADTVMSIDNVVAVASAAEHAGGSNQFALVVFGILVSIPIIVWGSTLVMGLMNRFPLIITMGAALLGYLGGAMLVADAAIMPWLKANWAHHAVHIPLLEMQLSLPGIAGALLVIGIGRLQARKNG